MTAVNAGAGPDVEHVVGGADGVLVVLHHDHGIAEIAQPLERFQQPRVVALVQPDRRLVEHVEHAREPRADLRGEPDALAFAARQRARCARQREIFEPDVDQEFEPVADFLEHPHRDLVLLGTEPAGQFGEPFAGVLDRHLGDLADVQAADLHAQRLGLEPEAVAGGAGDVGEVLRHLLARPVAVGLAPAPLEIGDDAFERLRGLIGAQPVVVDEADRVLARAMKEGVLRLLRQVLPFGVERELVVLAQRLQRLDVIGRGRFRPRRDRAAAQGLVLVGNDEIGVDMLLDAEPAAGRTGAERIVEREQPRLDLGNGEARDRAGELFREDQALRPALVMDLGRFLSGRLTLRSGAGRVGEFHHGQAVGKPQRGLERFREPGCDVGPHHQAIHHHVEVVLELLVERRGVRDLVEPAVDLHPLEAALHVVGELLAVLALAAAHHGRQQIEPRALGQRQHPVDHLRNRLAFDRQPGRRRIGHAHARPQQPHVVVDLGDGADGRTRIARGGLLLDRDGRGEAVDLVDVRLLHHLQELAGVGGKRFHIAALAFGIDGVESERGLAGAREPGEHHQLIARDFEIDILEIVLARATDRDHASSVGSRLAARSALVEEVVHAVRRRSQIGESEKNVPTHLCARTSGT